MVKNLASQATDWWEYRWSQIQELYQRGWKRKDIAVALGVTSDECNPDQFFTDQSLRHVPCRFHANEL